MVTVKKQGPTTYFSNDRERRAATLFKGFRSKGALVELLHITSIRDSRPSESHVVTRSHKRIQVCSDLENFMARVIAVNWCKTGALPD